MTNSTPARPHATSERRKSHARTLHPHSYPRPTPLSPSYPAAFTTVPTTTLTFTILIVFPDLLRQRVQPKVRIRSPIEGLTQELVSTTSSSPWQMRDTWLLEIPLRSPVPSPSRQSSWWTRPPRTPAVSQPAVPSRSCPASQAGSESSSRPSASVLRNSIVPTRVSQLLQCGIHYAA